MKNPIWTSRAHGAEVVSLPGLERQFELRLDPQDGAMLCALFSRDASHPSVHVASAAGQKSARFMERYYASYAHKSIADCGSTTVFAVKVSMLAAKAIEDSPMFSGQETSTRYVTFDDVPIWEPTGCSYARDSIARLMALYHRLDEPVRELVAEAHPFDGSGKKSDWEGAVRARSFDIRRSLLPAGAATQVAWHGNLRQLADHLVLLRHHPLAEVRDLAQAIWSALREDFAASFPEDAALLDVSGERSLGRIGAVEDYRELAARWMWGDLAPKFDQFPETFTVSRNAIDLSGLSELERKLLADRPRGAGLPAGFGQFGLATFEAPLDFGSYRDLHRQRRGFWRMPVLTPLLGFEPWYLEQVPQAHAGEVAELVEDVVANWVMTREAHGLVDAQHALPMGFRVPWRYTCGLPQVLYLAELRTPKTVHPTARRVAQQVAAFVRQTWPEVALHADEAEDDWTVRRGSQTIVKKD